MTDSNTPGQDIVESWEPPVTCTDLGDGVYEVLGTPVTDLSDGLYEIGA